MSQTISKFQHGGARVNAGGPRPGAGRPRVPREPLVVSVNVPRWCVYQTHPQAERSAAEDLTRSGYQCYAPLIAVRRQDPVVRTMFHKVVVSRFPGYGFLLRRPGDPWAPILRATGVSGILRGLDGQPGRVPAGEVERHMLDDDRLCDLEREVLPPLALGSLVTILDGALSSRVGAVKEDDGLTAIVELEMFGRMMPVRLPRQSLEAG